MRHLEDFYGDAKLEENSLRRRDQEIEMELLGRSSYSFFFLYNWVETQVILKGKGIYSTNH